MIDDKDRHDDEWGPPILNGDGKTYTKGFYAEGAEDTAVCLRPGTELSFEEPIRFFEVKEGFYISSEPVTSKHTVAIFREVDTEVEHKHHDSLEFADGKTILLNSLIEGQKARVLQLGLDEKKMKSESQMAAQPITERVPEFSSMTPF